MQSSVHRNVAYFSKISFVIELETLVSTCAVCLSLPTKKVRIMVVYFATRSLGFLYLRRDRYTHGRTTDVWVQ
jgi:hypothetical protein